MRIALIQRDLTLNDHAAAARALVADAAAARAAGADLAVFPECFAFGGYPPRDLVERPWLVERQWQALHAAASQVALPCIVGCVEPLDGGAPRLANSAAVLDGGRVTATARKRRLPQDDVFDDMRHFRPGEGPAVVELLGRRIGLTVCEDIWTGRWSARSDGPDPVADLAGRCDLVVNVSASPFHQGKWSVRRALLAEVAGRLGCPIVYANQVGAHDELLFDGGSCVVRADGSFAGAAGRWSEGVTVVDLAASVPAPADAEPLTDLHAALVTGIRSYCAKTHQHRVVLGLSGGIDSALVAALAVDALGAANVTGLLMPGPYSSRGSVIDALALADALGIRREQMAINRAVDVMLSELDPLGEPKGLMAENIQSRLRGTLVMAAANQLGAMALTTGNKSEIACGYCTIYGDMNGGLAPIGDLYKTEVWALSRHLNAVAGRERIPTASIEKAPSAELRENQTDQDSLPPYDVLDRILRQYLEDGRSPAQIVESGEDPAVVGQVVRLVELNEFKRRQGAPILRVSRKAFGVGRRMPVARWLG